MSARWPTYHEPLVNQVAITLLPLLRLLFHSLTLGGTLTVWLLALVPGLFNEGAVYEVATLEVPIRQKSSLHLPWVDASSHILSGQERRRRAIKLYGRSRSFEPCMPKPSVDRRNGFLSLRQ